MTISILGSGWLGLPLAKHLIENAYSMKLSTRSDTRLTELKDSGALPFMIDIEALSADIQSFLDADTLIINITSKSFKAYQQLVQEIEKSPIKKVLFISSTSVYQSINDVVIEDNDMENVDSFLYQVEQLFCSNRYFKTTVLRLSGLIGYSRHPGNFFAKGKTVQQPDSAVNLIHRDDCIGIINCIIKQSAWGEVFNACSTSHPSKRDFYTYARSFTGNGELKFNEASANQFSKVVSNAKVINQLGYSFIYPDVMAISFDKWDN